MTALMSLGLASYINLSSVAAAVVGVVVGVVVSWTLILKSLSKCRRGLYDLASARLIARAQSRSQIFDY